MNSEVIVSVVIPFYRNKKWLEEALHSVKGQTYRFLEVIIINDGSEDDISDLEMQFTDFKFHKTVNSGAAEARNKGIDMATGRYICFLDSDDIWMPDKVQLQLSYMLSNSLIWSHTSYIKFWDKNSNKMEEVRSKFDGNIVPKMFITCPIATPCVMILTSILQNDDSIRFNKNFRVGEDSYLWFKIAEKYPLGHLDDCLTKVRIRGQNAALNPLLQLEAKSQTYLLIKSRNDLFKNSVQYSFVLFGFYLCYTLYNFVIKKRHKSSIFNKDETIYILYIFPYIYLKIILRIFSL